MADPDHPPPYRHRHALVRFLNRRRRPIAALLGATALLSALLVLRPPPEPTDEVLVAAHDLDASAPLTDRDLTPRALPVSTLPEGALPPSAEPSGRSLNAPVREGEVITDARLSDPPALAYGPDLVAAPVRVADPGTIALLSPGNRVDVLAASGHDELRFTRTSSATEVVTDRPVLALPPEGDSGGEGGALVLLAVAPEEARALAGRAASERLSITIRG